MNEDLLKLVEWLDTRDPGFLLTPQMAAQMVLDVMRDHDVEGSHEYRVGFQHGK